MYTPKKETSKNSHISSLDQYEKLYEDSVKNPEKFWGKISQRLDWIESSEKVLQYDFKAGKIKWFSGGKLNASYNCIDRHAENNPDKVAIIWEGDDPNETKKITYRDLLINVSKAANVLKKIGVKKGDRVTIYLTMIPELAYIMLACARIGAVHSIIFGGFSAESIAGRIKDCKSEYIVTADEGVRGGKTIALKLLNLLIFFSLFLI